MRRQPLLMLCLALLPAGLLSGSAGVAQESPHEALPLPPLIERADPLLFLIVPEESEVAFDAHATLHRFTGKSRLLEGRVETIPVAIKETGSGFVAVKAASLATGNRLRDRNMRALLEVDRYPDIRFTLVEAKVTGTPAPGQPVALSISGRLQVRDTMRPLQLPITVTTDTDRIVVTGEFPLTFTDVGLTPPSFLFVKVDNRVAIRFRLVATLVAAQLPVPPL